RDLRQTHAARAGALGGIDALERAAAQAALEARELAPVVARELHLTAGDRAAAAEGAVSAEHVLQERVGLGAVRAQREVVGRAHRAADQLPAALLHAPEEIGHLGHGFRMRDAPEEA